MQISHGRKDKPDRRRAAVRWAIVIIRISLGKMGRFLYQKTLGASNQPGIEAGL